MENYKLYELLKNNNVKIEYDVFSYGIKVLKTYLLFSVLLFPWTIYLNIVIETVWFLVLFIPLRRYSGGIHFNESRYCLIFSVLFMIIIPLAISITSFSSISILLILGILSFYFTVKIGIIDHKNKRISISDKSTYSKKIFVLEFIYLIFSLLFILIDCYIVIIILYAIIINFLNVSIARLTNRRRE